MLLLRFLEASRYGKSIWACDGDDLRAYTRVRLWPTGPDAVSVGTWNRSVAALDQWVAWSLDAGSPSAPRSGGREQRRGLSGYRGT
ncbi:hypothetical protein [Streptomyces dangxiongensis]|uniref:hypothetical protein n=1 Tax=Streptomyces dangxiongensis TaxID=1442032 RepID=UPI001F08F90D|nr:hypothetical protein [Streptomyces dangxiongensis]